MKLTNRKFSQFSRMVLTLLSRNISTAFNWA